MIDKLLVRRILESAGHHNQHQWSVQGLGMFRLYLSAEVRLHVWDSRFKVEGVSTIHDHPWHFKSEVVAGALTDIVYTRWKTTEPVRHLPYNMQTLRCGEGCELLGEPAAVTLRVVSEERIRESESYSRIRSEIHESFPEDGTVTLVTRRFEGDPDLANVFYPRGGKWMSAEPRPAEQLEVLQMASRALERWF